MNSQLAHPPSPETAPAGRVTVVCMRWGTAYSKDYVRVLYHGVKGHLARDFEFICLSDDLAPICDGVRVVPMPDFKLSGEKCRAGFWPKLGVFKPGLFRPGSPVLFLDLDVVILRSLDPFVEILERQRGLHILREWNPALWSAVPLRFRPDRGGQSSVFTFFPEEQHDIYEGFVKDMAAAFKTAHIDQLYITKKASRLAYLPDDWAVSFKRHCVHYYPFNLVFKKIKPPGKARILVFHGDPKPADLIRDDQTRWGTDRKFGHGPVDWVKRYWQAGMAGTAP